MYVTESTIANNLAFNRGSDARLAGDPISFNPYFRETNRQEYQRWLEGWRDVNKWWGKHARWPVLAIQEMGN